MTVPEVIFEEGVTNGVVSSKESAKIGHQKAQLVPELHGGSDGQRAKILCSSRASRMTLRADTSPGGSAPSRAGLF